MAGLGHPSVRAMYMAQDLKEELAEDALRNWRTEEVGWMEKCAEVEGMESFSAWWDDENNVPVFGRPSSRILLLKARYESLKVTHADAFYWLNVERQEARKCMQIEGPEAFCVWWNDDRNFPASTTPKERVELIRARITAFLTDGGTTQVQARARAIQQAIVTGKAANHGEIVNELAEIGNHLQRVGVPMSGEEGEI